MKKFIPPFLLIMLCINFSYATNNRVPTNEYFLNTSISGLNGSQVKIDTTLCTGSPEFDWNGLTILTDRDSSYTITLTGISGSDSIVILNVSINYCLVCQGVVPYYGVDLDGRPDSIWILKGRDVVKRDGQCCFPTVINDTIDCISFNVYLDENAVGLKFDVKNPSPVGIEYYQVNCGSLIPLGEFVCLQGGTAYTVTFCMAGEDRPDYIIESIAGAIVTDSITILNDKGAFENFHVNGLKPETINWHELYPLNGEHLLDFLDLTDPENPVFSPGPYAPPRITYAVCGILKDVKCISSDILDCAIIDITVLPGNNSLFTVIDTTLYPGSSVFVWNGLTILTDRDGSYSKTLTGVSGSDSIIVLNVNVIPVKLIAIDTMFCEGPETFTWNGLTILTDRDSSYSHNFASSLGYDSIVTLNTFVIPATTSKSSIVISGTELPFVWNGNEYNVSGVYDIFRTNSFGCDSLLTLELNVEYESGTENVTDVETHQQYGLNCNVFPNPSDGDLNISFSGNINSDIKIDAIDISGRLVKCFLLENFPGINKVSLNMQDFDSGIYFLNITVNKKMITKEVIIE